MTGVMTASVPLDWQIHDTFFVVAHLHYVLIGGSVFPLLGSIHYWWPKMTGRMLIRAAREGCFWFVLVGIQSHVLSHAHPGTSRDAATCVHVPAETGWVSSESARHARGRDTGRRPPDLPGEHHRELHETGWHADENPWDADTLEWSMPSPAPAYNYMHIPVVESRYPLWDRSDPMPVVTACLTRVARAWSPLYVTRNRNIGMEHPSSSIWPFLMAVATGITIIVIDLHAVVLYVYGGVLIIARRHRLVLAKERNGDRVDDDSGESPAFDVSHLPTARSAIMSHCGGGSCSPLSSRRQAFAIVWSTYLYLRMQEATWPPWRWSAPDVLIGSISTVVILATARADVC